MKTKLFICIIIIFGLDEKIFAQNTNDFIEHNIATDFNGALFSDAGDVDSDGDMDIIGAAYWGNEISWWENIDSEFIKHTLITSLLGASAVYIVDLDVDGDMDFLAGSQNKIIWWENDGSQNFAGYLIYFSSSGSNRVNYADFDNDGDIDIVGGSFNPNSSGFDSVSWWENDGNQNFTRHIIGTGFTKVSSLITRDVDGDNDEDILCAIWGDGDLIWFENRLPNTFITHIITSDFVDGHWLDGADIDGDMNFDFVGASIYLNTLAWWRNIGNNSYTKFDITSTFAGASYVHLVDFDNDIDIDIFCVSEPTHTIAWWENTGFNQFEYHLVTDTFQQAISVNTADIDSDGDLDVIGTAFSGNQISWWENKMSLSVSSTSQSHNTITLHQNYPNPFNQITRIQYFLPNDTNINISIFSITGKIVANLLNQFETSGYKTVFWDGKDRNNQFVESGIYFYKIVTENYTETKKMILLK